MRMRLSSDRTYRGAKLNTKKKLNYYLRDNIL